MADYTFKVPDVDYIGTLYTDLIDTWSTRNEYIKTIREMLRGDNKIEFPTGTSYKIRVLHTYLLASIINEKTARYSQLPSIQVIPELTDDLKAERVKSSSIEHAIEIAQYEMERHGDGDVWSRVVSDAILLDQGVERIERASAAFWPELTAYHTQKSKGLTLSGHIFEQPDAIDNYKKLKGIPLRSVYVPLENYYPVIEGGVEVEAIQVETRTLRSLKANKLFDQNAVNQLSGDNELRITAKVRILQYSNQDVFAYFALPAVSTNVRNDDFDESSYNNGHPILLHAYRHNLGQILFNSVAGRFGGWKHSNNSIEGVGKALVELNGKADEIMSQVVTNARARYWPTLVHQVDPDRRGQNAGGPPKPVSTPEGQNIAIFKGEKIFPLFEAQHDDSVPWIMDEIKQQMSQLAGGTSLFGGRSPGVETGYHQNLQITQAEHLDEKIEQHISWGAVQRVTIMMKHIKRIGDVWVNYIDEDESNAKISLYTKISRGDLTPMPRMAAQVRKPRPIDFAAAVRSARDVTDERGGKGPLFSDETAREEILGVTSPDIEERRILVESEKRKAIASGVVTQEIQRKLSMVLAVEGAPSPTMGDASNADPSLNEAIQVPLDRGQSAGQSQPEAAVGREIANAQ